MMGIQPNDSQEFIFAICPKGGRHAFVCSSSPCHSRTGKETLTRRDLGGQGRCAPGAGRSVVIEDHLVLMAVVVHEDGEQNQSSFDISLC